MDSVWMDSVDIGLHGFCLDSVWGAMDSADIGIPAFTLQKQQKHNGSEQVRA